MLPRAVVQFDTPRRGRSGQHSFAGRRLTPATANKAPSL
jgi:hypothetical protein